MEHVFDWLKPLLSMRIAACLGCRHPYFTEAMPPTISGICDNCVKVDLHRLYQMAAQNAQADRLYEKFKAKGQHGS